MEKEQQISRRQFLIDLAVATSKAAVVVGGMSVVVDALVKGDVQSTAPAGQEAYPPDIFKSVVDPSAIESVPPTTVPASPVAEIKPPAEIRQLTQDEIRVDELKTRRDYIVRLAMRSGRFSEKLIGDLYDNLPFYIAAGEQYNIDWMVLWRIHEAESGASDPRSTAFNPKKAANSDVIGSMQLNRSWYKHDNEHYVPDSYKDLKFLDVFPERHKGDREQIAAAAHMLSDNLKEYQGRGYSYDDALLLAMSRYSGEGSARARIKKIEKYNKILKTQFNLEIKTSRAKKAA